MQQQPPANSLSASAFCLSPLFCQTLTAHTGLYLLALVLGSSGAAVHCCPCFDQVLATCCLQVEMPVNTKMDYKYVILEEQVST